ncbi:MAG: GNAT family N-acetyltransferase [Silvanigrellaceae bacterium]|nr:GNAT family N-acetyltransferase [Silvanigrellaceae bacterium]
MNKNFNIVRFSEFKDKVKRDGFECGNDHLNDFIKTKGSQYEKNNLARIFLAIEEDTITIAGYYTLSGNSVDLTNIPENDSKKLPKHLRVPVALIGKLAVDKNFQGQGLGSYLLMDALDRILNLSEEMGYYAVEVDAIDDKAKSFYDKYGFQSLLDDNKHMYISLKKLKQLK